MYAKLCVYFYVKMKWSECKYDSEFQQSAEHNISTKQEESKIGLEKTVWHGASWVVPFDRHISDKLKGNIRDWQLHTKYVYDFVILRMNCDYFTKWYNKPVFVTEMQRVDVMIGPTYINTQQTT
jgi:hypothetical protein